MNPIRRSRPGLKKKTDIDLLTLSGWHNEKHVLSCNFNINNYSCVFYPHGFRSIPTRLAGFWPRCRDAFFGLPPRHRDLGGRPRRGSSISENQQVSPFTCK